jgi:hypothetical protein
MAFIASPEAFVRKVFVTKSYDIDMPQGQTLHKKQLGVSTLKGHTHTCMGRNVLPWAKTVMHTRTLTAEVQTTLRSETWWCQRDEKSFFT